MPSSRSTVGNNLVLASFLAALSYLPFELVAKITLVVCVYLFVADPFPPSSRLIALVITIIVGILSKLHKQHTMYEKDQQESYHTTGITTSSRPTTVKRKKRKEN